MVIFISESLIKNIKNLRKKDWNEDLMDEDIFNKIEEVLLFDQVIFQDSKVKWNKIKDKFQGLFIEEKSEVVYFTQMLDFNAKPRSRNTYVAQNFRTVEQYAFQKNSIVSISVNPFDLHRNNYITAESIKEDFKKLKFLGVFINKSLSFINHNDNSFDSISNYIISRNNLKNKNLNNNSTYIKEFDQEKKVAIFGRLDGANGASTLLTCKIIFKLNNYLSTRNFLFFYEIKSDNIYNSKNLLEKIKKIGFKIINSKKEAVAIKKELHNLNSIEDFNRILKRNQGLFIKNIIQKYINFKNFNLNRCFACDYSIEANFIASHIYRYSDIIKDYQEKKINLSVAANLIVSGDNGFFLCPNQDKEFEKGMIIFDLIKKEFVANRFAFKNIELVEKINSRIDSQSFYNIEYSKEFENNIANHLERISNQYLG